jgi:hypothetical protein
MPSSRITVSRTSGFIPRAGDAVDRAAEHSNLVRREACQPY